MNNNIFVIGVQAEIVWFNI